MGALQTRPQSRVRCARRAAVGPAQWPRLRPSATSQVSPLASVSMPTFGRQHGKWALNASCVSSSFAWKWSCPTYEGADCAKEQPFRVLERAAIPGSGINPKMAIGVFQGSASSGSTQKPRGPRSQAAPSASSIALKARRIASSLTILAASSPLRGPTPHGRAHRNCRVRPPGSRPPAATNGCSPGR